MWGKKERDEMEDTPVRPAPPAGAARPAERAASGAPAPRPAASKPAAPSPQNRTRIGNAMTVKGEINSREDIFVDGVVEGAVKLEQGCLTIGAKGNVQADVETRSLVLLGSLKGKIHVTERIEIRKTGSFEGDIVAGNIVMEDGAVFRGSIDIIRAKQAQAASNPAKPVQAGLPAIAPKPAAPKPAAEAKSDASKPAAAPKPAVVPKPAVPHTGVK